MKNNTPAHRAMLRLSFKEVKNEYADCSEANLLREAKEPKKDYKPLVLFKRGKGIKPKRL